MDTDRRRTPRSVSSLAIGAALVLVAVAARMALAFRDANYDVQSFQIVAPLAAAGENFYAVTRRFNYAPLYAHVLAALWKLSPHLAALDLQPAQVFRLEITALLTLVDLGIAGLLRFRFGARAGWLFLLNPVSILISGAHGQFDNVAILAGLAAFCVLERGLRRPEGLTLWGGALLLGLSLGIKHLFFLAPFCLAMRRGLSLRTRAILCIVPCAVFVLLFVPYLDEWRAVLANVFFYRSRRNAPLLHALLPDAAADALPAMVLFLAALFALGWWRRERPLAEWGLEYLVVLTAAAPACTNQYLAIPSAAIAVRPNVLYAAFVVVSAWFLIGDVEGLGLARSLPFFPWTLEYWVPLYRRNHDWMILLLALGFAWSLWRPRRPPSPPC